jgi:outer membrane protein TolC
MSRTSVLILSLLIAAGLFGQEHKPLSKEALIAKVLESNRNIKISEQEFLKTKGEYLQTKAVFLPSITASHTGFTTTNPLMAFGSKLNQAVISQNDFNPTLLNNPERTNNFATKIEVQQPLINLEGLVQRQAAKRKMEATRLELTRTTDQMLLEIEKAYMQLQLAHKAVAVLEKAHAAAYENKILADNSFSQGYLQRADVLAVEVRLSEVKNQLQLGKSNVENASDYLSFLMGTEPGTIWNPTDELEATAPMGYENQNLNENRPDIMAMALVSEAFGKMNKAHLMTFLPKLNAFGSYEWYDNKPFQGGSNGYLAGAQLSWDLFQGNRRLGKLQTSKAQYDQSQLALNQYIAQSQMEINQSRRQLKDLQEQLIRSELAREQSKEALRIRTNRFEQGLEKTTDLLQSETQYAQKQLEYYQTIYEYSLEKAYLEFLLKGA